MPPRWLTTVSSAINQTLSSSILTTLFSWPIDKMDNSSFGAMEVSIWPRRSPLISPLLGVYSWQVMNRSSSTTDTQTIESTDGHRMEHNSPHHCQSVHSVMDSSSIRTMISTVLNRMQIKWYANRWLILRVQRWLWPEQVVKDRLRRHSTVLWESLSRIYSTCMSLIGGTIGFNCFGPEKSMQRRWRSTNQMEQRSHWMDQQE